MVSFLLAEGVVLSVVCVVASALVLYYYTKGNWRLIRPRAALPLLFVAFVATVCPVGLLVVDIEWGTTEEEVNGVLYTAWKVVFWLTQALSWVVLPVLQEYAVSGEFTTSARLKDSVKANAKLYAVMGVVLVGLLVYVAVLKGVTAANVSGLAVASSNAFGLLLIILFLGYGLAQLPRSLWYHSIRENTLSLHRWCAPAAHEALETNELRFSDLRLFVSKAAAAAAARGSRPPPARTLPGLGPQQQQQQQQQPPDAANAGVSAELAHIQSLLAADAGGANVGADRVSSYLDDDADLKKIDVGTQKGLVQLHAKVIHKKAELESLAYQWGRLVDDVIYLEEMEKLRMNPRDGTARRYTLGWLDQMYHLYVREAAFKAAAVFCGLLSVALLWSFAVATPVGHLSVVKYLVVDGGARVPLLQQFALLVLLPYAAAACYWSLFRLKLFELNFLVPHFSHPANLCFTAVFLCRLIIPLCYCFLNICGLVGEDGKSVAYTQAVIANMNTVVLLGENFNRYMPCLLLIVVAGTLTDFFPKLLSKCGLDVVAFSSCNDDPDRIQEGTDLLRQERSTRERSRRHLYAINPLRNLEDVEESSA